MYGRPLFTFVSADDTTRRRICQNDERRGVVRFFSFQTKQPLLCVYIIYCLLRASTTCAMIFIYLLFFLYFFNEILYMAAGYFHSVRLFFIFPPDTNLDICVYVSVMVNINILFRWMCANWNPRAAVGLSTRADCRRPVKTQPSKESPLYNKITSSLLQPVQCLYAVEMRLYYGNTNNWFGMEKYGKQRSVLILSRKLYGCRREISIAG